MYGGVLALFFGIMAWGNRTIERWRYFRLFYRPYLPSRKTRFNRSGNITPTVNNKPARPTTWPWPSGFV